MWCSRQQEPEICSNVSSIVSDICMVT